MRVFFYIVLEHVCRLSLLIFPIYCKCFDDNVSYIVYLLCFTLFFYFIIQNILLAIHHMYSLIKTTYQDFRLNDMLIFIFYKVQVNKKLIQSLTVIYPWICAAFIERHVYFSFQLTEGIKMVVKERNTFSCANTLHCTFR